MVALSRSRVPRTDYMRARFRLTGTLIALAWISVDAVWIQRQFLHPVLWPDPLPACALGVLLGQAALLFVWAVSARERQWVRIGVVIFGVCLLSFACALTTDGAEHVGRWMTLLSVYAMFVGMPLAAVKHLSMPLNARSPFSSGNPRDPWGRFASGRGPSRGYSRSGGSTSSAVSLSSHAGRGRPVQFSLARLFSLTTSVALLLVLVPWLQLPNRHPLSLLSYCLFIAVWSLLLLGALAMRHRGLSIAGVLLFVPLCAWLLRLSGLPPGPWIASVFLVIALGASLVGSMLALKTARPARAICLRVGP